MIKINVDEGYAFDYQAILEVKHKRGLIGPEMVSLIANDITQNIGWGKYREIIYSQEYLQLLDVNERVFKAVDRAKKDEVLASSVDSLNYERYICKKNLQEKFFNTELKEKKN